MSPTKWNNTWTFEICQAKEKIFIDLPKKFMFRIILIHDMLKKKQSKLNDQDLVIFMYKF